MAPAATATAEAVSEEDPLLLKHNKVPLEAIEPLHVRLMDVVKTYWHLGFIAFGGPTAHIGILRDHLVIQNNWIDDDMFMELFALGQGLPGPTSTQLVISTAVTHGGPLGGFIAFFFWCLPAFTILTASGMFLYSYIDASHPPIWLLGVPPAAVALIFKAFVGMGKKVDRLGVALALTTCMVAVMINGDERISQTSSQFVYPAMLVLGALASFLDSKSTNPIGTYPAPSPTGDEQTEADRRLIQKIGIPLWVGACVFLLWGAILAGTIILVNTGHDNEYLQIYELFFRIGSLIYGGGVVVLPMLQNEVVPKGWITNEQFFQGLGLTQSLPGPLFNFSCFIGATYKGFFGALVASMGLFGPGFILIFALLPFWTHVRHYAWFKAILKGLNAAAIGLIGSGCVFLYESAVTNAADAMVFVLGLGLASYYNVPAPVCILVGAIAGAFFSPAILNVGQVDYH